MSGGQNETTGGSARAQSNVIGVALLIGLTMVSLGALTATVGTVVDSNAAVGDVDRVASDLDRAIEPVESAGTGTGRVTYAEGSLGTETRTIRVFRDDDLVVSRETDAIVYDRGEYRVTAVGGAVIRDHAGSQSMTSDPPVSASPEVVTIGVVELTTENVALDGTGPGTRTLVSEISHERLIEGDPGEWTVAIETPEADPWRQSFEDAGATVYTGHFEGDEHRSVVATFEDDRQGHVVIHRVETEGRDG